MTPLTCPRSLCLSPPPPANPPRRCPLPPSPPNPPSPPCPLANPPQALVAADRVFGSTVNRAGYKTISGCGVIQGDGIDVTVLKRIAGAIEAAGFSAENVAYGMGGGLLQKVSCQLGRM